MIRTPSVAATALLLLSGTAHAGWTAKQSSTSGGKNESADLFFENDFFRIDPDKTTSVIIDLNGGKLTFLNHERKKHASITIEEVIKLRDQQLAEVKKQLPNMPPEMRKQMEAQIKMMEGEASGKRALDLKDQNKKDKVNGYECKVYTWSATDGGGEACIADKNVGVDPAAFKKATEKLADKLAVLSGGRGGPSSFAMLQLGKHGFPVRTKQKVSYGEKSIEVVSEMSDIKNAKIEADKFQPPKDYEKSDLANVIGPGPGGAPKP
jgi:uncharacterized protein DUF4412